jgi:hypothetical protein
MYQLQAVSWTLLHRKQKRRGERLKYTESIGVTGTTMEKEKRMRLNLTLEPELAKRFNKYMLEVAKRRGEIPHALKTKIIYKALEEFLDKYENNYDVV